MSSILFIAVLACDYQRTTDGKQDGRTLGPHSLTRLRAGVNLAHAQVEVPASFRVLGGSAEARTTTAASAAASTRRQHQIAANAAERALALVLERRCA